MRIVLICNEYPPEPHGGIGTFTQDYAKGLVELGHGVHVIGTASTSRSWIDNGVQVTTIKRVRRTGLIFDVLRIRRHILALHSEKPIDIVESPDFQGTIPFHLSGIPTVVRLHNTMTAMRLRLRKPAPALSRWREHRTLSIHRDWIGVSEFSIRLTEQTFGLKPRASTVAYNPVSASQPPYPAKADGLVVLFVGTVNDYKGAYRLAESAKVFLSEVPEAKLVYAGPIIREDNKAADERIRQILGRSLSERCCFLGRISREEVRNQMSSATVFAAPSLMESFGLTVAEAMSAGLPVVANDEGPMPEIITSGTDGFLIPIADSIGWAKTISSLLLDSALREKIGAQAVISAERFTMAACITQSVAFYEQVINRSK